MICFTILCSLLAGLAAAPCKALAQSRGGTFSIAYKDEPATLNPLLEVSSTGATLCQIVFDGLITLTPHGRLAPRIAKSWDVSDKNTVWTFNLRKDVVFHDGVKLTARDVKFTYDVILKNPMVYSNKDLFKNVKSISIVNDYAVRFTLSRPDSTFLINLYAIGILPRHILGKNPLSNKSFNRQPVGTGPFRVREWVRNKHISLTVNENYFRGRAHLNEIRLVKTSDVLKMWSQLELGDVDAVYNDIMPSAFDNLQTNKRIATYRLIDYMTYVLIFNYRNRLFADRNMRYALNAAIDRPRIIQRALSGNGIESSGPFAPGAARISTRNTFNPDKSVKLLKTLGYRDSDGDGILDKNGGKLSFTVLYDSNNILKKRVLQEIRYQLSLVGVEMTAQELSIPELIKRGVAGDFDLIFYNYNHLLDFPSLVWRSTGAQQGVNISHYKSGKVDAMFDKLAAAQNTKTRDKIMKDIHKSMSADVAGIFLFQKYNLVAVNKKFKGFKPGADKFFWEFVTDVYVSSK